MNSEPEVPVLWIKEASRQPIQGPEDSLVFQPGVNVIYGVPNTGKSKWLRMLDYLLGDDSKADEAFGDDIAAKYDSLNAVISVCGQDWELERRWKEPGQLTKIRVNGDSLTLHQFTLKLLDALKIPVLHYPQGNPYSPKAWPELGWRSLFRHVYRRQLYWADFADRQPESEQHACILQFVGIAETVFSEQYGNLVALEKKLQDLQSRREHFVSMLQEVSKELIDEETLGVALTPDSIATAIARHELEANSIQEQREVLMAALRDESSNASGSPPRKLIDELSARLAELRSRQETTMGAHRRTVERANELAQYRASIEEEVARMQRAIDAGVVLSDIKITHCPACDQTLGHRPHANGSCYLCSQPVDQGTQSDAAVKRLKFEQNQLTNELDETNQLVSVVSSELVRLDRIKNETQEEISRVELSLRPTRSAAASVLPPELAVLDQQTGRTQERIAQLKRIAATLRTRETIAEQILQIQSEVSRLETTLNEESKNISFERASDALTDGMNTFLNVINEVKPGSWTQEPVEFVVRDRGFHVRIGKSGWRSKLGGTLTLFFLLAYHYALCRLAGEANRHYPGLCILDFPPQLDGVTVSDSEDFVLIPFVRLMTNANRNSRQLIAAGSSFAGVEGAHRIEFRTVWK